MPKRNTATKQGSPKLADQLNKFAERSEFQPAVGEALERAPRPASEPEEPTRITSYEESQDFLDSIFEGWDERDVTREEFFVDVAPDSLESEIGYSSLHRQMHAAFIHQVAFYKSPRGGSCTTEEARKRAFHACRDKVDAKRIFKDLMRAPLESLNFVDLMELQEFAPRVTEWFWEHAKREGRKEFESGHLSANIAFPAGYMKQVWNVARYVGVRESFIDEWRPRGGIELALIDMMAQTYFQWQYWLEHSVRRSQTPVRSEEPEYSRWKAQKRAENLWAKMDGSDNPTVEEWLRPFVSERDAVEHATQMADRWQRMFTRALRQLRDLRRYAPVTINNPNQVNIAAQGGQQINLTD